MYIKIEAQQVIDMADKTIDNIDEVRQKARESKLEYANVIHGKQYGRCKTLRSAARLAAPYSKVWVSDEDIAHLIGHGL